MLQSIPRISNVQNQVWLLPLKNISQENLAFKLTELINESIKPSDTHLVTLTNDVFQGKTAKKKKIKLFGANIFQRIFSSKSSTAGNRGFIESCSPNWNFSLAYKDFNDEINLYKGYLKTGLYYGTNENARLLEIIEGKFNRLVDCSNKKDNTDLINSSFEVMNIQCLNYNFNGAYSLLKKVRKITEEKGLLDKDTEMLFQQQSENIKKMRAESRHANKAKLLLDKIGNGIAKLNGNNTPEIAKNSEQLLTKIEKKLPEDHIIHINALMGTAIALRANKEFTRALNIIEKAQQILWNKKIDDKMEIINQSKDLPYLSLKAHDIKFNSKAELFERTNSIRDDILVAKLGLNGGI